MSVGGRLDQDAETRNETIGWFHDRGLLDVSIQLRYVSMAKWNEQCREGGRGGKPGEEEGNTGLAVTWVSSQSSNGRMRGSEASRCE